MPRWSGLETSGWLYIHYVTPGDDRPKQLHRPSWERSPCSPLIAANTFLLLLASVCSTQAGSVGGRGHEGKSSHEALIPNKDLG